MSQLSKRPRGRRVWNDILLSRDHLREVLSFLRYADVRRLMMTSRDMRDLLEALQGPLRQLPNDAWRLIASLMSEHELAQVALASPGLDHRLSYQLGVFRPPELELVHRHLSPPWTWLRRRTGPDGRNRVAISFNHSDKLYFMHVLRSRFSHIPIEYFEIRCSCDVDPGLLRKLGRMANIRTLGVICHGLPLDTDLEILPVKTIVLKILGDPSFDENGFDDPFDNNSLARLPSGVRLHRFELIAPLVTLAGLQRVNYSELRSLRLFGNYSSDDLRALLDDALARAPHLTELVLFTSQADATLNGEGLLRSHNLLKLATNRFHEGDWLRSPTQLASCEPLRDVQSYQTWTPCEPNLVHFKW